MDIPKQVTVGISPSITGNIGSCTTQNVGAVSGRDSIWTINYTNTLTNSCTGQVTQYTYWQFSGFSFTAILVGCFLLWAVVMISTDY